MRQIKLRYVIIGGACLAILLAIVAPWIHLFTDSNNRPKPAANQRGSAAPSRVHKADNPSESRYLHSANKKIPLSVVPLLQVTAFSENTGDLDSSFKELLSLTAEECSNLHNSINFFREQFHAAEIANARVIVEADDSYIQLDPCSSILVSAKAAFLSDLQGLLGPVRGEAAYLLISKQLRHGGDDKMRISFLLDQSSPLLVLEAQTYSERGNLTSQVEGTKVNEVSFAKVDRWKHLEALVQGNLSH